MTARAMLWVRRPTLLLARIGGITVLERQLWTIRRAGVAQLWLNAKKPEPRSLAALRLPPGLEIFWADRKSLEHDDVKPPYLAVSGDCFIRAETLAYIAAQKYPISTSFRAEGQDAAPVEAVPYRKDEEIKADQQDLPPGACLLLREPLGSEAARDWLLATGLKAKDGLMARLFDRHISLSISRLLMDTPVSPNLMTAASSLVGLAGASLFLKASPAFDLAGAALIWLHAVLDGVDGELARIRFQESDLGADLDLWADNAVHLALFACLGLGLQRTTGRPICAVLAAVAGAAVLACAAVFQWSRVRERRAAAPAAAPAALDRLVEFLAQRDFIYVFLLMTYWGLTYEFLWLGALGAPLFLAALLVAKMSRTQEVSP